MARSIKGQMRYRRRRWLWNRYVQNPLINVPPSKIETSTHCFFLSSENQWLFCRRKISKPNPPNIETFWPSILLTIEQKIIFGLVLVGLKGYLPSIGEARSCKSGIDTRGGDWGVGWMIAHSIKRQMRESLVIIEPAPIHSMDGDQPLIPSSSQNAKILSSLLNSHLTWLASRLVSSPLQISCSPLLSQLSTSTNTNIMVLTNNNMVVLEVFKLTIMSWSDSAWNLCHIFPMFRKFISSQKLHPFWFPSKTLFLEPGFMTCLRNSRLTMIWSRAAAALRSHNWKPSLMDFQTRLASPGFWTALWCPSLYNIQCVCLKKGNISNQFTLASFLGEAFNISQTQLGFTNLQRGGSPAYQRVFHDNSSSLIQERELKSSGAQKLPSYYMTHRA